MFSRASRFIVTFVFQTHSIRETQCAVPIHYNKVKAEVSIYTLYIYTYIFKCSCRKKKQFHTYFIQVDTVRVYIHYNKRLRVVDEKHILYLTCRGIRM